MDKRCKDCIHKVYSEHDTNNVWPFCNCRAADLRNIATKYWNQIHDYSIKYGSNTKIKEFPKENIPCCQLVQAAYAELRGIKCINYKTK